MNIYSNTWHQQTTKPNSLELSSHMKVFYFVELGTHCLSIQHRVFDSLQNRQYTIAVTAITTYLCHVFHIGRVQACHGNAAITCHVDVMSLDHALHLWCGQSSEGEHANLLQDMRPVTRAAVCLQCIIQHLTHLLNATRHHLHIRLPIPVKSTGYIKLTAYHSAVK